jgi:transglutaminase-like putative cysteine protease
VSAVISDRVKMASLGWLATVLTSLSFFPALEQKSYLFQGAFFTAIVIGVGTALRALRAPAVVVCLVELLVLAELLLLRFGTDLRFGLLPTGATIDGIGDSVREGVDVAQKFAAPAPTNEGLLLMVLTVIALAAIAVDTIAVGLRRVPLSGLPLLALYTIPVTILPKGLSFIVFVPGAATYIAMLMADERDRLAHWGRLVSRNASGETSPLDLSSLTAAGRRVSVIALSVAVVVPILLPAISGSILDAGRSNGLGEGDGITLSFEDPMVGLANQLRTPKAYSLLEIRSGPQPSYLRLAVLANPGPAAWTADVIGPEDLDNLSSPSRPTGLDENSVAQHPQSMEITLDSDFPSDSAFLPIPFDVNSVNVDSFGYVRTDQTAAAKSQHAISGVNSYVADYTVLDPSEHQLNEAGPPPADIVAKYAHVPPLVPAEVGQIAAEVTQSGTTDFQRAQLLQSWFREPGNFRYDLTAAYGYGYGAMGQFLEQRRGFCQQFAATMAIMARTLNIPSRVVVGFLQPSEHENGNYVMTTKDVHAWPELYFDGVGWVKFEPTPGRAAPFPDYAPQVDVPDPTTGATTSAPTDSINDPDTAKVSSSDRSEGPAASAGGGNGSGPIAPGRTWWIALIVIAVGLLPAGLRVAVRRARMGRPLDPPEAAESAWLEMRDRIRDLRLPWTGSMTPRARERAVAPLLHGDRHGLQALNRLAISVERARYAIALTPAASPIADAREVMSVIARQTSRGSRLRAFLWPSSLMPDIRRGWARLTQKIRGRNPGS